MRQKQTHIDSVLSEVTSRHSSAALSMLRLTGADFTKYRVCRGRKRPLTVHISTTVVAACSAWCTRSVSLLLPAYLRADGCTHTEVKSRTRACRSKWPPYRWRKREDVWILCKIIHVQSDNGVFFYIVKWLLKNWYSSIIMWQTVWV